ncbi:MAG TPA: succinyl-diaminopimelate desuccinylase [Pedomonas sp.]|uniref:succinyl-diaminopimelate desuccinylase n=1 Tax=Pedomonas sp. TaxID=2976421 RepID=UPI002F3FF5C2
MSECASSSDSVALAQELIRCPSVTPADAGALDVVERELKSLGFSTWRLPFGEAPDGPVDNLYARLGESGPHFCYAGHTDVVPAGDSNGWTVDPFAGTIDQGFLIGRGAADMKGSIAAFLVALRRHLATSGGPKGSISLLITGDEEGPARHGTTEVLDWMEAHGHRPDHCLVGEPTSARQLGDMVKVGRRGSLNATITVHGIQGHVAYPHRADNPITRLVRILDRVKAEPLDTGTEFFDPSNLEVTNLDVGNPTENLIPARATARLNIRFNDRHTGQSLSDWLRGLVAEEAPRHDIAIRVSGESFFTPPGLLSDLVVEAIQHHTGRTPELSTSGGTSDARFIRRMCPVLEFGLVGESMHKADEKVAVEDVVRLTDIYETLLNRYFGHTAP